MTDMTSRRWLAAIAALLWMALIFFLSSRSTLPTTGGLPADIAAVVGHLVAYAILAALIRLAISGASHDRRADIIAIALATLYGVSDELHQSFVAGRDASIADLVIDFVGGAIGVAIVQLARSIRASTSVTR